MGNRVTPMYGQSYGQIIGPITSNTTMTIDAPQVLVVAVGAGGAGGGTGGKTVKAGDGGYTLVYNSYQTVFAGGGLGGWSGNYHNPLWGPGGAGGVGEVGGDIRYYQILNGNSGQQNVGMFLPYSGGQGGPLPSGYQQAIQQVLQQAGINYSVSLTIPSTPCTPSTYPPPTPGSPGSGYGAGGCGNAGASADTGGGGGSGAIVVALMDGGTLNIIVGQGGQITPGLNYSCPSCAAGLSGVVYLVPLP
ncbi:MAG: hypothetical protein QXP36_13050 [Conexivisphaerales archaeon]